MSIPAIGLTARRENLAAFDERCIPTGCVAPRSHTPGILGRRALPAGRLARLAATRDFHHGLLRIDNGLTPLLLQVAFGLEAFEFHF